MPTRYTFYDVCNNDKPVLVDARHSEVCEFLGIKAFNYKESYRDGRFYKGKYKVIKTVNGEVAEPPVTFSDEFRREWDKVCERYRDFEWTQTWSKGVKKLAPGV